MKKLLSILLCCLLLTACGQNHATPTDAPTEPPTTAAPAETPTRVPTDEPSEIPTEAPTEAPEPTEAAPVRFTIYTPNENADGFYDTVILIDTLTAQNVADELIKENALNADVAVNFARMDGAQLMLDFNSAFRDQLLTYGTAGERMMIGSVVNTFLSAYGAETVFLTVDGGILESGHVVYDFPLEFFD